MVMSEERRQRLEALFRQREHKGLLPGILEAWFGLGVNASPLSFDKQTNLVTRLRVARPSSTTELEDITLRQLHDEVAKFIQPFDRIVIIGWSIDSEPAVIVPAETVARSILRLPTIYPDGFLLLEPPDRPLTSTLVVDLDNEGALAIRLRRQTFSVLG